MFTISVSLRHMNCQMKLAVHQTKEINNASITKKKLSRNNQPKISSTFKERTNKHDNNKQVANVSQQSYRSSYKQPNKPDKATQHQAYKESKHNHKSNTFSTKNQIERNFKGDGLIGGLN